MVLPPSHAIKPLPVRTLLSTEIEDFIDKASCKITSKTTLSEHFGSLKDPRQIGMIDHKLIDIITLTVCAVICGADDWVGIALFAEAKKDWFKTFLDLPNGIPSHDTFSLVFRRLSPTHLQACFSEWTKSLVTLSHGDIVAIDGKTLRRSYDRKSGKGAIHMVSAWAQRQNMVLGQLKTEEKSNEITAIPQLLNLLDIKGCIVTIDAMGCQRKIAKTIIDRQADYVLMVKGNQGNLHKAIIAYFNEAVEKDFEGITYSYYETIEKNHGRLEIRRYWTIDNLKWLDNTNRWQKLTSVGMVESERHLNNEVSIEKRYFISSLDSNAQRFGRVVRGHWSVENNLHWSLDVSFNEDQCRVRTGHGAENFAVIRHIALGLLKQEKSAKVGIKNKRLKAAANEDYLLKVLIPN